ncbi:MAG: acetyltransferase [Gammaproteobacteria bacterium]|nr:acetyltransferase [Gammaproteobacteria bacterium]
MNSQTLFSTEGPLGSFSLRELNPHKDAELLHSWVSRPYAKFWLMQNYGVEDVRSYYLDFNSNGTNQAYLGSYNESPSFLIEVYDPANDPLAEHYKIQTGDVGLHFLVAPSDKTIQGFTFAVIIAVMKFVFSHTGTQRIVVEPDSRNEKLLSLNKYFNIETRKITMGNKTAQLAIFTREQYRSFMGF